jgi:hypothetical protein
MELQNYLMPAICELESNSKWFLQDGASPSSVLASVTYCIIISQIGKRGPEITNWARELWISLGGVTLQRVLAG